MYKQGQHRSVGIPVLPMFQERQGSTVAFLDRFVSRGTGEAKEKPFSSPYRRTFSQLEDSGSEAMEQFPEDSKTVEDFIWALKDTYRTRYKKALEDPQPLPAEARFFLSQDRMCAYACLLPPLNGGDELTLETFWEDLHYEGIQYGVLEDSIPQSFAMGYRHIFPVARGKAPIAGQDGKVTELFQRRRNMRVEVQDGSQVDFGPEGQLQPIRKGAVICLIRRPREGTCGMDVAGQEIPSPPVLSAQVPQGKNTEIGRGGQALIASVDGILYIENDRFCIHEQKIIDGDLDQFQGTLRVSGNLYIGGSVDGGADIEASGDIVVNGTLGQARVYSSGGTIRIQQGVCGTKGKTFLRAARQIQSPTVEYADVDAGTSVIAEAISYCTIHCGGTVYVMSGRGLIVDSEICAEDSVLCLRIGNLAGGRTLLSVGYPPHVPASWKQIKEELICVQATLDKLWDNITLLRKKGTRISDGEEAVLTQLLEQRELYTTQRELLNTQLQSVNQILAKKTKGRVRCEKVFPALVVQIGKLMEEITTVEEGCNIHMEDHKIYLK